MMNLNKRARSFDVKNQYGLVFDGVNEYLNIDRALTPLASTTVGTISAWVKPNDSTPAASQDIIMFGHSGFNRQLLLRNMTTGKLRAVIFDNDSVPYWELETTAAAFADNTWTHVALVQNGTAPVLYVNGVAVTQSIVAGASSGGWFSAITFNQGFIGRFSNSATTGNYYNGTIDEVSFWNTNLTAAQVLELYNKGKPYNIKTHSATANLVAYYKLGDETATFSTNWNIPESKSGLENKKSIVFDGVNEYLNIDTIQTALASDTKGTWSYWIKPVDATPAAIDVPISFCNTTTDNRINMNISTAGIVGGFCRKGGVIQWQFATNAIALSDNTWTHIALVQDAVSPVIYINGTAVAQTYTTTTDKTVWFSSFSGATALNNGRLGDITVGGSGEVNHFNGNIDEVRFYNTNLTAAQMTALYNLGSPAEAIAPLTDANLVTHYRMGDAPLDTNTVIEDVYGSNNGTGVNLEAADLQYVAPLLAVSANMEATDLVTGAGVVPGWSLNYDGVNEYMNIDTVDTALAATTKGTWSAWVKATTTASGQYVIAFGHTAAEVGNTMIILSLEASGTLFAVARKNTPVQWALQTTGPNWTAGAWFHVALVQDAVSPVIYFNGTAVAQSFSTTTDKTSWFNAIPLLDNGRIACRNLSGLGNIGFTNGNIAQVSFWNTNLTAGDITAIYNGGSPGDLSVHSKVANLVTWYREERSLFATNWTLKDAIGSNNGTSVNMENTDMQPDFPAIV